MKTDEQVLVELESAADGLLFMSESDYPFETIRWEALAEVTPEHLRAVTGSAPDVQIATESVEDFFRVAVAEPDWKNADNINTARRFQTLVCTLQENLTDLHVYRVGEVNIPVLIVGRNPATGNSLGISTRVVET